jgi:phage tail-like protein
MALTKEEIKIDYPLPVYNYRVTLLNNGESLALSFAEVAGLSLEYEPVTYQHGFSFVMGSKIIPGQRQPVKLSMRRGMVKRGDYLQRWLDQSYRDPFSLTTKRDILIDLCDEAGRPVIRWKVQGALPTRLEAPTFDANSNEVAIERMEFIAHGLQVDYNPAG